MPARVPCVSVRQSLRRPDTGASTTLRLQTGALVVALAAGGFAAISCGPPAAPVDGAVSNWQLTPDSPVVGQEASVAFTLVDAGRPVGGAALEIEAHMAHPGMAPVIQPATDRGDGAYGAPVTFTMSGEWIVFVTGTLPDGRRVRHRAAEVTVRLAE